MKIFFALLLALFLPVALQAALPPTALVLVNLEAVPGRVFVDQEIWNHRDEILQGIDDNLTFLGSFKAEMAYQPHQNTAFSKEAVERSLERFRFVLLNSETSAELREYLIKDFRLYRSVGRDGKGTVRFTGYYQPVYLASRVANEQYRFPIFRPPEGFEKWPRPHPTRVVLEGYAGTGNPESPVRGKEIAYLRTRYEAFMIHVQGSAILELPDGSRIAVGYAGNTDYRFVGFVKSCLQRNKLKLDLPEFFRLYPEELDSCLARNNRFIFFQENDHPAPIGNLGVPVIAGRSIATDKRQLPPGAFGLIRTQMPVGGVDGEWVVKRASRIVLDQDAGGAIKGPGRVDVFMGTGKEAEKKAHSILSDGELYYFALR